jgi:hypothetical protein
MYDLKKVIFKNAVKSLAKSQFNFLKYCVFKKVPHYLRFK